MYVCSPPKNMKNANWRELINDVADAHDDKSEHDLTHGYHDVK